MTVDAVEHVVVLMLENRSFDSLLGWLYESDAPSLTIPPAAPGDEFRGLAEVDLFVNTARQGAPSPPVRGVGGFTVPTPEPGEEFTQFFGTPTPAPGATPTMTGVLEDFVEMMQQLGYENAAIVRRAPSIMQSYTPAQLPVLNQLAKHYAVSDAWFASVPSQTNPNRAFALCGTSDGLVNSGELEEDPRAKSIEDILGMRIGDDRFPDRTIFNALHDAQRDWMVFWQTSYLPEKISRLLAVAVHFVSGSRTSAGSRICSTSSWRMPTTSPSCPRATYRRATTGGSSRRSNTSMRQRRISPSSKSSTRWPEAGLFRPSATSSRSGRSRNVVPTRV